MGKEKTSATSKFGRATKRIRTSTSRKTESYALPSAESGRLHRLPRNVGRRSNTLHAQLEVVGIRRILQRGFVVDQPGLEQIPQRLVEGLHAVLRRSGRNRVTNRACLLRHQNALPDKRRV